MRVTVTGLVALAVAATLATAQELAPNRRQFTVVAREGRFEPDWIRGGEGRPRDHPSAQRRGAVQLRHRRLPADEAGGSGETVSFQFRADQVGRFVYYCSLSSQPQCAEMRGTLVVAER